MTLNNRVVAKDTEQDLVLKPSSYWQEIKQKAENVLRRKIARNRRVTSDDTMVVVSVNDRSQRDLTKRFEKTDINWSAIEGQLLMWEQLFHQGKKLRLCISINYIEHTDPPLSKTDKRGRSSITKRMLDEREAEIDAEHFSGPPSIWRDVYKIMRCPGPPCRHEGQYCWQDPVGKKHYRLRTHHMRSLVKYVEQGGIIETHDDIPNTIREQLYAEETQRLGKKQKGCDHPASGSICPPINIHVLPVQSSQPSAPMPVGAEVASSRTTQMDSIDIPGLLDVAVEEYTNWQQSRVSSKIFKDNINKARDIALENCLDLKQIFFDQDPDFFITRGVKIGVARRFVSDIIIWFKEYKQNKDCEGELY